MQISSSLIFWNVFREALFCLITVVFYAWFGNLWFQCPIRIRRVAAGWGINFGFHLITRTFLLYSPFSYVCTAVNLILFSRILWRPRRGFSFWISFFFCFSAALVLEFPATLMYTYITPNPQIFVYFGRYKISLLRPETLPVAFASTLLWMYGPLLVTQLIRNARKRKFRMRSAWIYLFRFGLVITVLITFSVLYGQHFDMTVFVDSDNRSPLQRLLRSLPLYLTYGLAVALLIVYGWQDIQQYRLHRRNRSLLDQNEAYRRVIDSTREFRHNIANMIYGLEGILLTRDLDKIEAYYAEMARRCALINNENAVALNRLSDPALTALLLRKLDASEQKKIPFYINVDSGFSFDSLPSHCLCEVMGNLLDNALEAAEKSEAPRVDLSLRRTDEYSEILLSNTHSAQADLSFLTGAARSSKPGHQATGLASVHRLLARHSACFNQYERGRYIETSLCEYRLHLH